MSKVKSLEVLTANFLPGERVELVAPHPILYPIDRSFLPTGTILGTDEQTQKQGYFIVKIDRPLYYDQTELDGTVSIVPLNEVRESRGNMRRIYDQLETPKQSFWRRLLPWK